MPKEINHTVYCVLYDEENETGLGYDYEIDVNVNYRISVYPAEPDVGIMNQYSEMKILKINPENLNHNEDTIEKINKFCLKNKDSLKEQAIEKSLEWR